MALFLKLVSGVYLVAVWTVFAVAISVPPPPAMAGMAQGAINAIIFFLAIGLSIPAVVLFGFAQIVGDIRVVRNQARMQTDHLKAMRSYYEPTGR